MTRRDPIADRARARLAYVQRVSIERLSSATDRASRTVEAMAMACTELSADSTVRELRNASQALHACSLELSGALDTVIAEGASLEIVAEVREAMSNG